MKLRAIPASRFVTFDKHHQELLTKHGAVAVNDKLLPIWENDFDILLLYGGRGGGKSEVVCDHLLNLAMNEEYFRCYYGRKVYDTVRGSCFATLIYCIKKNKLEHLFNFSESDSSSMVITCIANGNKFIPFGSDKADKLKSIKDPTHIWCEEFDQFIFNDFKALYPTLRTLRGANCFICTFNTHEVLPNHFILKLFFPEKYEGKDKDDVLMIDLLKNTRIKKLFVNYTDNYFIDKEKYRAQLLLSSAGNMVVFEAVANGAWGVIQNDAPWLFAWNAEKHMSKVELFAKPELILFLCWDFNRNPMACTVIQWDEAKQEVYIIEVIKEANIGTEGVCEIVRKKYPDSKFIYMITGDYSGDTPSSLYKEQVTNYSVIKKELKLADGQIKISPNPSLERNRTLINAIFHRYKVLVCPVKARHFKFDAEMVKQSADGKIDKGEGNRKDPAKQADVLDTVRYFFNQFFGWFLKL